MLAVHVGGAARPGAAPRPRRRAERRRRRAARPAAAHPGAVASCAGGRWSRRRSGRRPTGSPRCAPSRRRGCYDVTDRLDIPPDRPARIQYLTASPDSQPLDVPLVAKGDAGTVLRRRDRRARPPRRRRAPRAQPAPGLDRPARGAAGVRGRAGARQGGVGRAGRRPHRGRSRRRPASCARASARPTSCGSRSPTRSGCRCSSTSARALAASTAPGAQVTVHDQVATRLAQRRRWHDHIGQPASPVNGLARFLAALDVLAAAPADELEWAFRGVLDLFSSRLDAWFTSLRHRPPRRAACRSAARRPPRLLRLGRGPPPRPRAGRRQPRVHRRAVAGPRRQPRRCCAAAGRPTAPRMRSTSTCRRRACARR